MSNCFIVSWGQQLHVVERQVASILKRISINLQLLTNLSAFFELMLECAIGRFLIESKALNLLPKDGQINTNFLPVLTIEQMIVCIE